LTSPFKLGDFVWCMGEGFTYVGQLEDGEIMLVRPIQGHPFHVLETEYVYAEDMAKFYKENGR